MCVCVCRWLSCKMCVYVCRWFLVLKITNDFRFVALVHGKSFCCVQYSSVQLCYVVSGVLLFVTRSVSVAPCRLRTSIFPAPWFLPKFTPSCAGRMSLARFAGLMFGCLCSLLQNRKVPIVSLEQFRSRWWVCVSCALVQSPLNGSV